MLSLKVTEDVSLETLNISDSQELFNCIEAVSYTHLTLPTIYSV